MKGSHSSIFITERESELKRLYIYPGLGIRTQSMLLRTLNILSIDILLRI